MVIVLEKELAALSMRPGDDVKPVFDKVKGEIESGQEERREDQGPEDHSGVGTTAAQEAAAATAATAIAAAAASAAAAAAADAAASAAAATADRTDLRLLQVQTGQDRHDLLTWKEAIEHQVEMAGFTKGSVETPPASNAELGAEFRAVQMLTFTVISRCYSLGVQIALNSCRGYLDAGDQALQFITSTYQVTDDLYIGQLEERMTHLRMGDQETATNYYNWAQQLLANMGWPTSSTRRRRGTVALQGEAGKQVLIPVVLYAPDVQANLLSAGQLKESGVKMQDDGNRMLLVLAAGEMLGRVTYTGRVLYTDLCPCSTKLTTVTTEVVALRAIVLATKSTSAWWHARLAHIGVDTITSLAKHEVATSLDIKPSTGTNSLCVSCDGGKLARHTFPDKGSDADDALAVMHIDLCGPFRVAAKDDSLYFLLLKDRKTRYVWVRLVAKKSDVLREFKKWLVVAERQTKKSVLMLRSDQGGEFIGKETVWRSGDADGGGVGADDAASHGRAAPLVAPRPAAGHLGTQLLGALDNATGDDAVPAAVRQEARLVAGLCVGLHGAVPGPKAVAGRKAAAEGQVGPSSRCVGGEQGLGAPRHHRQQGGHHVGRGVLRDDVAGGVEVGAWAGVGADVGQPVDGHLGCGAPIAHREVDADRGAAGRGGATDFGEAGKEGVHKEVTSRGAASIKPTKELSATGRSAREATIGEKSAVTPTVEQLNVEGSEASDNRGEQSGAEESTDSNVVEVQLGPRRSGL
ncbi:unnamed protein product [Closterium sp. NIES-54]